MIGSRGDWTEALSQHIKEPQNGNVRISLKELLNLKAVFSAISSLRMFSKSWQYYFDPKRGFAWA